MEMNLLTLQEFSPPSLVSSDLKVVPIQASGATAFTPSSDDIAYRAFLNYQNHGSADGHDFQDWLRAEAELIAEHKPESPSQ